MAKKNNVVVEVTGLTDAGGDVLIIDGTATLTVDDHDYKVPVQARSHVSAITNHYPPEAYDEAGNRKGHWENLEGKQLDEAPGPDEPGFSFVEDTPPREMTRDEATVFATRLLTEAFIAGLGTESATATNLLENLK